MDGSTILMSTNSSPGVAASIANAAIGITKLRPMLRFKTRAITRQSIPSHSGRRCVCLGEALQEKPGAVIWNIKAHFEICALSVHRRSLAVEQEIGAVDTQPAPRIVPHPAGE